MKCFLCPLIYALGVIFNRQWKWRLLQGRGFECWSWESSNRWRRRWCRLGGRLMKNYWTVVCNGLFWFSKASAHIVMPLQSTRPELTVRMFLLVHLIVVMRPWLLIRCAVDFLVVNHILDEKYYSETFHAISVQKQCQQLYFIVITLLFAGGYLDLSVMDIPTFYQAASSSTSINFPL